MSRRKALTFEQAQEIRALYTEGKLLQKEIANIYGVIPRTVSSICSNKILTGEPRKKRGPTLEKGSTYKGVAMYTNVLTNSGWKQASSVKLSDKLVTPQGNYCGIESIEVESMSPIFRLTFSDDATLDTAADHRFLTLDQKVGYRSDWMVKTTKRLLEISNGHHIPTCAAVPGPKWESLDPYAIGVILGDGSTVPNISSATVYNKDPYILNYMQDNFGWARYKYEGSIERVQCKDKFNSNIWKEAVGKSKANKKSVPEELLMADPESRLAVLQGLMDTDGCAEKEGRLTFATVSTQLASDVRYLVRSLGGKSNTHWNPRVSEIKGYFSAGYYKTSVTPCGKFIPFRLPRKIERCKEMKGINRNVKHIQPIEDGYSISFVVKDPCHQFVVQDFIVVHDATGTPSCRKIPKKNQDATSV